MIFGWLFKRKKKEEREKENLELRDGSEPPENHSDVVDPSPSQEEDGALSEKDIPFVDSKVIERRREPRKVLEPARLVRIEVPMDDGLKSFYVSVVDISRHGMKLISDIPFERDLKVPIKFFLEKEPEEINARIAWCKELMPKLYAVGLDLKEMTEEQYSKIDQFLEKFAPYEERRAVRVKRPFLVEILGLISPETGEEEPLEELPEEYPQKFFTYATEISTSGMRIISDFRLPENKIIRFKIYLGKDKDPVEVKAKIMWQQRKSFGVIIGLQFEDVSQDVVEAIRSFIFSP